MQGNLNCSSPEYIKFRKRGQYRNNYYDKGREEDIKWSYRRDNFGRSPYRRIPQFEQIFRKGNRGNFQNDKKFDRSMSMKKK